MFFQYYFPEKLKGAINVIWEQQADQPMKWQILPSGYVELIFRIGSAGFDDFSAKKLTKDRDPSQHFCFLSGLHTRPLYITFSKFHFMGIQLNPVAVESFFGIHCDELLDEAVEGDLLLNRINFIEEKINTLDNFRQRACWLEKYMADYLAKDNELQIGLKLDREMNRLLNIIGKTDTDPEEITGYSRTHTYRLFKKWFGLAPNEYIRFKKCMNALESIHFSSQSFTEVSYKHGFYDQSHFNRTFKRYMQMTPGDYRKQKTGLIGQLPF